MDGIIAQALPEHLSDKLGELQIDVHVYIKSKNIFTKDRDWSAKKHSPYGLARCADGRSWRYAVPVQARIYDYFSPCIFIKMLEDVAKKLKYASKGMRW